MSGIHRFAQEHDWFVQVVERYSTATDIRRALKNWAPAGCLVDRAMSNGRAPDAFFRGIPTVYLDQNPGKPSAEHPCLLHDSAASASLAAQELFANDCITPAMDEGYLLEHTDKMVNGIVEWKQTNYK
ncbi:MAG: hypothetical protein IKO55_04905, partial [Kiritimatiellae bacterium]|nr:hypothetical protein [Kiritimatiellia bacterium]